MSAGNPELLRLVESFFRSYLLRVRGASPHTVRSYRDALKLLLCFLADADGRAVSRLTLDDIKAEPVLLFLEHLEVVRGNGASTRNQRLAAVRCFTEHLLRNDPTRAGQYRRILNIPGKKCRLPPVFYLEPEEVRVLLRQPDRLTGLGAAHHTLMLFLYNTGARVSEALGVRPVDLDLVQPFQVLLQGKGRKERLCPLWRETVEALGELISAGDPDGPVFRNARRGPLSRDGVAYLLRKYAALAGAEIPRLAQQRMTPHVLRHSCAVALLQAGLDITVIRDYLGHASVATTNRYITTNLATKRDALEAFAERAGLVTTGEANWVPTPDVLAFLESL